MYWRVFLLLLPNLRICNRHLFFYTISRFEDIIDCNYVKRLRMALDCDSTISILLIGPPASTKTIFLTSLIQIRTWRERINAYSRVKKKQLKGEDKTRRFRENFRIKFFNFF